MAAPNVAVPPPAFASPSVQQTNGYVRPRAPNGRRPPPIMPRQPRKVPAGPSVDELPADFISVVTSVVNQPPVLFAVVLAAVITVGHYFPESDVLAHWTVAAGAKSTLGVFIEKYSTRIIGAAWFVAAYLSVAKSSRPIIGLMMIAWIIIVPEATPLEYVVQAYAIRAYFRINNPAGRVIIVFAVGVAYWFGWLVAPALKVCAPGFAMCGQKCVAACAGRTTFNASCVCV